MRPDRGTCSDWERSSRPGRGLGCHRHQQQLGDKTLFRQEKQEGCSWGIATVTPLVTFQGAPVGKRGKLFVKTPNKSTFWVVGFESLPVFLVRTSGAERFQALYYTQYTPGKEIRKKYMYLLLNFSSFLNDAGIAHKYRRMAADLRIKEVLVYGPGSSPWLQWEHKHYITHHI